MNQRDALAGGAPDLEALVWTAAECAGEWVIVNKGGGEGGGDDLEWVAGVDVSTKVTESEVEVGIGVEVRKREGMIVEEGRA